MRTWFGALGVVSLASLAVGACGGKVDEAGGGSCGMVQPCGGNIVGNWTVNEACADVSAATQALLARIPCSGVSIDSTTVKSKGQLSFSANASYTLALESTASIGLSVPTSCLQLGGALSVTCAQLSALALGSAGDMVKSIVCAGSKGGCSCSAELLVPKVDQSGTYQTSGSELMLRSNTATTNQYCVQSDSLHLIDVQMGSASAMQIRGDLLAKRR